MCSATASSNAALFGTWLYNDMAPVPSSAARRRMDTAFAPSRSISCTAVRTIRSRLSGLPMFTSSGLDDVHRTCDRGHISTVYVRPSGRPRMSTDYILPTDQDWTVDASGAVRFDWDYADGREKLLSLYQKGKDKQWDAEKRIDWDLEVDPHDVLGLPDETIAIYGTKYWDAMSERERAELRLHSASWQFSQFLHGEQGAMITAARIVETVPDLDAKFYSATQTMDEARHAELYSRFLREKVGML